MIIAPSVHALRRMNYGSAAIAVTIKRVSEGLSLPLGHPLQMRDVFQVNLNVTVTLRVIRISNLFHLVKADSGKILTIHVNRYNFKLVNDRFFDCADPR